jgi:uncharacterized protein (DUF1778 family)
MKRKQSTDVIVVRIPPAQRVEIRGAAITAGKSLGAYVREAALERAREPSTPRQPEEP